MSLSTIYPVPKDANNYPLTDRGRMLGTKNWTAINTTTGQAVSFTTDVKEIKIVPTQAYAATAYYILGSGNTDYDDPVEVVGAQVIPVAVAASTTICTIKAKSGTIDVGVFFLR